MIWIGLIWLRIGTSGGLLRKRWWTFVFHKMLGSFWVAAQLAASEKGLSSMSEWWMSHLRFFLCGAISLTRGRVCRLQLLLAFASVVILGSESRGTRDHILLSQIRDIPFRRLLRLAEGVGGECVKQHMSLSLMLRPTVSRPVFLGIRHPSGAYDQIFITVRELRVCWCGTFSLTRGRVCLLQLLLVPVSALILGSESRGNRDHILLYQIRDFPFRRFLRLAGSWWRYSTPLPHGLSNSLC
jgi:hypothetical protein